MDMKLDGCNERKEWKKIVETMYCNHNKVLKELRVCNLHKLKMWIKLQLYVPWMSLRIVAICDILCYIPDIMQ